MIIASLLYVIFHILYRKTEVKKYSERWIYLEQNDIPLKFNTHGETRTRNLRFRRPTPYPLGHAGEYECQIHFSFKPQIWLLTIVEVRWKIGNSEIEGVEPGPSGWKPDLLAVRPCGILFLSVIEPDTPLLHHISSCFTWVGSFYSSFSSSIDFSVLFP